MCYLLVRVWKHASLHMNVEAGASFSIVHILPEIQSPTEVEACFSRHVGQPVNSWDPPVFVSAGVTGTHIQAKLL